MKKIPLIMSGVVLVGYGGPEMLKFRDDLRTPEPRAGEVLIKVKAAGVNNTDINTRIGWYSKSNTGAEGSSWSGEALNFPRIQGIDACGEIVGVGEGCDSRRIGERVLVEPCLYESAGQKLVQPWFLGSECDGAFAEYLTVSSSHAHEISSNLSDIELASFPCSYSTAENMLTRCDVGKGDRVLITGASGGVGSAAVQLAKRRGAIVYAVTSETKLSNLLEIGADQSIDRNSDILESLGKDSMDVVIDLVAGSKWPNILETLCDHGRYAVSGAVAGPHVELDVRTLYLKDLKFFGCTALDKGVFKNLISHIEGKSIRPLVAETYPLSKIVLAQESFQRKKHIGKIVLNVSNL
ncbi:MAG: alcohol dehydrogenase family protein [Proteobacteria bacterium]|jgi:NADPH:quinone reductase-like Zn-dependent oxidoreductase|nr:alcohol dehydrogenase family protein [Pseudomonadota bacterium]